MRNATQKHLTSLLKCISASLKRQSHPTILIDIRVDEGEKDTICFVLRRGDIVRYFKLSVDWGGDKLWYLFWGKKRGQWVSLTRDYDFVQGFKSVMRYAGKFNTTC